MSANAGLYVSRTCQKCARHGFAGSPVLWQNFADYDRIDYCTATISSRREVDERRTRGVRQGRYAGSSDTIVRAKKKKKKKKRGACDAAAQVVIGVEQELR
jgi:hypothetical protein